MKELLSNLKKFQSFCWINLKVPNHTGNILGDLRFKNIEITEEFRHDTLQNERYFAYREPYEGEKWNDEDQRIDKLQGGLYDLKEKVKSSYKLLIDIYKKKALN